MTTTHTAFAALTLFAIACNGQIPQHSQQAEKGTPPETTTPTEPTQPVDPVRYPSSVWARKAATSAECPTGGVHLDFGIDVNLSGALDPGEVNGTEVVCNGKDGLAADGTSDGTRLIASRQSYINSDGSTYRFSAGMWDTVLSVKCFPGLASDGSTRCLPEAKFGLNNTYYSEDTCTGRVAMGPTDCGAGFVAAITQACSGATFEMYSVDAAFLTSIYKKESDGSCTELVLSPPYSYRAASLMAPADFVEMTDL